MRKMPYVGNNAPELTGLVWHSNACRYMYYLEVKPSSNCQQCIRDLSNYRFTRTRNTHDKQMNPQNH